MRIYDSVIIVMTEKMPLAYWDVLAVCKQWVLGLIDYCIALLENLFYEMLVLKRRVIEFDVEQLDLL